MNNIPKAFCNTIASRISSNLGKPVDAHFAGIGDNDIIGAVCEEFNAPLITIDDSLIDQSLLNLFEGKFVRSEKFIPLFIHNNTAFVVTPVPFNPSIADHVKQTLNVDKVGLFTCIEQELTDYFTKHSLGVETISDKASSLSSSQIGETKTRLTLDLASRDTWGLVSSILASGLSRKCSDIHIQPEPHHIRIRGEVDGTLIDLDSILNNGMSSRSIESTIFNKAKMDDSRRMIPQNGNIPFTHENRNIDLRIASVPILLDNGENACHITIRFQDSSRTNSITLESLHFNPDNLAYIKYSISNPGALCIIAGPTGSGKTTTLNACLKYLNKPDKLIYTVEDPVENYVPGIVHIPVTSVTSFPDVLKVLLRKKPHVIMVGEIRNKEVAEVVLEAAQTGHTVLSTVHVDYACEIPERLQYAGVEPYQIAQKIELCSSQRLIKLLCTNCSEEFQADKSYLEDNKLPLEWAGRKLKKSNPRGCPSCTSGYSLRKPLIEIIRFDDELRDRLVTGITARKIQSYAIENLNFKTLREQSLNEIIECRTDINGIKGVIKI